MSMRLEGDVLIPSVLGIVLCVEELSDCLDLLAVLLAGSEPDLYTESLLASETLVYDSRAQYLMWIRKPSSS